jgi:hypothetical protein
MGRSADPAPRPLASSRAQATFQRTPQHRRSRSQPALARPGEAPGPRAPAPCPNGGRSGRPSRRRPRHHATAMHPRRRESPERDHPPAGRPSRHSVRSRSRVDHAAHTSPPPRQHSPPIEPHQAPPESGQRDPDHRAAIAHTQRQSSHTEYATPRPSNALYPWRDPATQPVARTTGIAACDVAPRSSFSFRSAGSGSGSRWIAAPAATAGDCAVFRTSTCRDRIGAKAIARSGPIGLNRRDW